MQETNSDDYLMSLKIDNIFPGEKW